MAKSSWTDQRMENIIGGLLRTGVALAAAVTLIGAAVFLFHHGGETLDRRAFSFARRRRSCACCSPRPCSSLPRR